MTDPVVFESDQRNEIKVLYGSDEAGNSLFYQTYIFFQKLIGYNNFNVFALITSPRQKL
jgi:hypothetical protein